MSFAIGLLTSCMEIPLQDLTMDPDADGNKTSTFKIYKVLEIDDVNVNGINIMPDFEDWFSTYRINLGYKDGKISTFQIDNGSIPFTDKYGYTLPEGVVDVYFDNSVQPNAVKRKDNGDILATFYKGIMVLNFTLDCKSVSYRYMFTGVNE